jgi:predicted PurR-regulated permease PerM
MKNKAFKLALTIVILGVLVFGVSFAKATTNEEMIKILQSLIQVLQQMIVQLQTQLAQRNTTTTTNPQINTSSINGVIYESQ